MYLLVTSEWPWAMWVLGWARHWGVGASADSGTTQPRPRWTGTVPPRQPVWPPGHAPRGSPDAQFLTCGLWVQRPAGCGQGADSRDMMAGRPGSSKHSRGYQGLRPPRQESCELGVWAAGRACGHRGMGSGFPGAKAQPLGCHGGWWVKLRWLSLAGCPQQGRKSCLARGPLPAGE